MEYLIRYEVYKEVSMYASELPRERPNWFYPFQNFSQRRIMGIMTHVELYPTSYAKFLLLYPFFRATLTEALIYDIDFLYKNKEIVKEWLAGNRSITIGDYSVGAISPQDMDRITSTTSPLSYSCLKDMGWLNRSLQIHTSLYNCYMQSNDEYTEDRDPNKPYNQSKNDNNMNFGKNNYGK